jgi:hypothetical protein
MDSKSLLTIADRTAGQWLEVREGDIRADRTSGRRAAAKDIALVQRRHQDFEAGLVGRAKSAVLALRTELNTVAADNRRQIDEIARERDENIGQKLSEARETRQSTLAALENKYGPSSAKHSSQARALEQAERDHRSVRAAVAGRLLRIQMRRAYLPALAFLAVLEVPINRLAFELFFQDTPLFSLILAAGVGILLMFLAHTAGLSARREAQPGLWKQVRHGAALVLIVALSLAVIYGLAAMRQLYVQMLQNDSGTLQQQVESILNSGPATTVSHVVSTKLGVAGVTLMILNLAVFVVGATLSFIRHDPHPDYEAAWRAEQTAKRRLTRTRTGYEGRLATTRKEHDTKIQALDELLRETQSKHDQLAAEAAAIEPFFFDTVDRIANAVRGRSLAFVEGALGALPDGTTGGSVHEIRASTEPHIREQLLADADQGLT